MESLKFKCLKVYLNNCYGDDINKLPFSILNSLTNKQWFRISNSFCFDENFVFKWRNKINIDCLQLNPYFKYSDEFFEIVNRCSVCWGELDFFYKCCCEKIKEEDNISSDENSDKDEDNILKIKRKLTYADIDIRNRQTYTQSM
ncbi:hypothetical protein AGMMS49579_01540 [Spirochaetia bacterium]|nr:hypothetical protein AGMMS49579_01540 [Spirochaetia bacterium]